MDKDLIGHVNGVWVIAGVSMGIAVLMLYVLAGVICYQSTGYLLPGFSL